MARNGKSANNTKNAKMQRSPKSKKKIRKDCNKCKDF